MVTRRPKSTSLIRKDNASRSRMPVPSIRRANQSVTPFIQTNPWLTASAVRTTGMRWVGVGHPLSGIQRNSLSSTSWQRNSSTECLAVGGRGDFPFMGPHREESFDLLAAHVLGMVHALSADEATSPIHVIRLGTQAGMKVPQALSKRVQQTRGVQTQLA